MSLGDDLDGLLAHCTKVPAAQSHLPLPAARVHRLVTDMHLAGGVAHKNGLPSKLLRLALDNLGDELDNLRAVDRQLHLVRLHRRHGLNGGAARRATQADVGLPPVVRLADPGRKASGHRGVRARIFDVGPHRRRAPTAEPLDQPRLDSGAPASAPRLDASSARRSARR